MYPLIIVGKQIEHLYKVSIKWGIIKHENAYMRDATECTNSIGYALFAVIRTILSDVIKCTYYSKNSELKITLLLVNIIVNTECQHSQITLQDYISLHSSVGRVAGSRKYIYFNLAQGSNPINAFISFSSFVSYHIFTCIL